MRPAGSGGSIIVSYHKAYIGGIPEWLRIGGLVSPGQRTKGGTRDE